MRYLAISLCLLGLACNDKVKEVGTEDPTPDNEPTPSTTTDPDAYVPTPDTTIQVMVVYTQEAWDRADEEGYDHRALAAARIELTNLVLSNSGISHRVELIHTTTDYAVMPEESVIAQFCIDNGYPTDDPGAFGPKCSATWVSQQMSSASQIASDRLTHGADVVMLMLKPLVSDPLDPDYDPGDGSGGAAADDGAVLWQSSYLHAGAALYYHADMSFVHELGHLLGAEHDRYEVARSALEDDGNLTPTRAEIEALASTYADPNFGYTLAAEVYTVMAYPGDCLDGAVDSSRCYRGAWFSNPNVEYQGSGLGDASNAYNACFVEHFGSRVASYHDMLTWPDPPPALGVADIPVCADYQLDNTFNVGERSCDADDIGGLITVNSDPDLAGLTGCATYHGNLSIGSGVEDLTALDSLSIVDGDLRIFSDTLTDGLHGLEGLSYVEGTLAIGSSTGFGDTYLPDLLPLGNLRHVGALEIRRTNLNDLRGLEGLGATERLIVEDCLGLGSLIGLDNLVAVTNQLTVQRCAGLADLSGFDSLAHVGTFTIADNAGLTSLDPLGNSLESVNVLVVEQCPSLTECDLGVADILTPPVAGVGNGVPCP